MFRSLSFGTNDTAETELLLNKDEVILFFQYLFATYVVEQPVQMQRASTAGGSMMMQPFRRSSDFIGAPHRDDRDAEEYEDEDDDEFEDDSDEEGKVEEAAFQRQGRSNEFYVCPEDLISQWYRVADQTGTDELNWLEFLHFCLFFKVSKPYHVSRKPHWTTLTLPVCDFVSLMHHRHIFPRVGSDARSILNNSVTNLM